MTTSRQGRHPAAHHRWPIPRRAALLTGLLAVVAATGSAIAAEPSASPGPTIPGLTASGPFGIVPGFATDADAGPATVDLPVLDGWARDAPILVRPTSGTLAPWHAVAFREPDVDPSGAIELGEGDGDAVLRIGTSGTYLVRVAGTLRPDGGAVDGTWWWRVAVPDHDAPEDEAGPPPPGIRLGSGDDVTTLELGDACYVGTCGDIGGVTPPDLLPTVRTIAGAPLSLTLEDGSNAVGWAVTVTPADGGGSGERALEASPGTSLSQAWLTAPDAGAWVVLVSVTFDRERGRSDGYGRIIVEEDPGP